MSSITKKFSLPFSSLQKNAPVGAKAVAIIFLVCSLFVIAIAIGIDLIVRTTVNNTINKELQDTLSSYTEGVSSSGPTIEQVRNMEIATKLHNGDVGLYLPGLGWFCKKCSMLDSPEQLKANNQTLNSLSTRGHYRLLTQAYPNGFIAESVTDLTPWRKMLTQVDLLIIGGGLAGVLLAGLASVIAVRTCVRPQHDPRLQGVPTTQSCRAGSVLAASDTDSGNNNPKTGEEQPVSTGHYQLDQLVADAGHELRTLLTSLRTNIELLITADNSAADALTQEDWKELRSDIRAQLEELTTLIADLMALAREDQPCHVYEKCNLVHVVETSLERAQRRRNDIVFCVDLMPWFLYAEPQTLSRAIVNVLDNSIKWSPAGGTISVTLKPGKLPDTVELTVSDEGPGITPEDKERVFERFYRSTSAHSIAGSGLGLAIVKQTITSLGGAVWVAEPTAPGASIVMRLPGKGQP